MEVDLNVLECYHQKWIDKFRALHDELRELEGPYLLRLRLESSVGPEKPTTPTSGNT